MKQILEFGASVSFTGVVTYKNATEVAAAAQLVPHDRIMVETDSPYLSPEPKSCHNSYQAASSRLRSRFTKPVVKAFIGT